MIARLVLPALFIFLVLNSCDKSEDLDVSLDNLLVGHWVEATWTGEFITFNRASSLPEDNYGLSLRSNGSLVERKNAGWCGTPPITYADFGGNWSQSGSDVVLNVDFWGGTAQLKWEIETVSTTTLIVRRVEELYPSD